VRIIAGSLKGRRLVEPGKVPLRPTSDSLRETLFNVLGPTLDGVSVLDGFAGTGALGLEALSRGAARVTFVEMDRRSLGLLRENITKCGVENQCEVLAVDFLRLRTPEPRNPRTPEPRNPRTSEPQNPRTPEPAVFDLVLLDPPYDLNDLGAVVDTASALVASDGRLVLEHSRRRESPAEAGSLSRVRLLTAGDSALSFYRKP
jgi:16S rRNA (guanine966-N2)-methyltransferase